MPTGYRSTFEGLFWQRQPGSTAQSGEPESGEDDEGVGMQTEEAIDAFLQAFEGIAQSNDTDWRPFPDKETFLVAVAALNPRSPLSVPEIKMMLAFARAVGGKNVPSFDKYTKSLRGLRSLSSGLEERNGSAGNLFFTTPLRDIISRQFANPEIRNKLHFFARRSEIFREFRDGNEWERELLQKPQQTITLRNGQIAYIGEPIAVVGHDRAILPYLWVEGMGGVMSAVANELIVDSDERQLTLSDSIEIEVDKLTLSSPFAKRIVDYHLAINVDPRPLRRRYPGKQVFSLPLIVAIDDWGGGRSRKWDPHHSLLVMLAGLDREELDKEKNIHLFTASNHATPSELMEAFVDDLRKGPFEVWDCFSQSIAIVDPYLLAVCADNPMAAELSASAGMKANYPCRVCDWGGTTKDKNTEAGVRLMLKGGNDRRPEDTIHELATQMRLASQDCSESQLRSRWSSTGVKDPTTSECCSILFQLHHELSGKAKKSPHNRASALSPAELGARMKEERANLKQAQWKSSLLAPELPLAFDVHNQTPPEGLHTLTLGPLKYLAKITGDILNDDSRDHLLVTLEACATEGIGCGKTFRASYYLQHLNSLVGRELRALCQVMAPAMAPLVEGEMISAELQTAWLRAAELSKLVWVDELPRSELPKYQERLDRSIRALMAAVAEFAPTSLISRPKYHLLMHLADAIGSFGVAANFATERTERFVAVQRAAVAHSNRMANSRDVALRLLDQQLLRHLMTGGYRLNYQTKEIDQPCDSIVDVTGLRKNQIFRQKWGIETSTSQQVRSITMSNGRIAAIRSIGGEDCRMGNFVLYDDDPEGKNEASREAKLMLQIVHPINKHYGMRSIRSNGTKVIVPATDIVQLINAPHDCVHAQCTIVHDGAQVMQERRATGISKPSVRHLQQGRHQRYLLNHTMLRHPPVSYRDRVPASPDSTLNVSVEDVVSAFADGMEKRAQRAKKKRRKRNHNPARSAAEADNEEVLFSEDDDSEDAGDDPGADRLRALLDEEAGQTSS
ncbi:hypothetical protein CF326_g5694 [Tilletia indica]|nr:hypothetical protein CF326_g5694 [Tilletia indica]